MLFTLKHQFSLILKYYTLKIRVDERVLNIIEYKYGLQKRKCQIWIEWVLNVLF